MLIVTACLLATALACSKDAAAPAKPAAKAPAESTAAPTVKPAAAAAAAANNTAAKGAAAATGAVAASTAPINANCPITGDPVDLKEGGSVAFKGHTVGFCCPKCSGKFEALDDAGKIAALAKNGTKLPQ
jgi:hypothetical protein